MNRYTFILVFCVVLPLLWYIAEHVYKQDYAGVFLFFSVIVVITLRRKYLRLENIWDSPLSDIPKYFREP
ncbi:hypothetical protein [Rufibacter tibetensis]|uniref:Uncharacterized protein n=1 Tax=Rufibacter tibetensis TaxID=512763 RepID=A0A0P0CFN3_9BACT|nr:hypothetical protein [Rufibacter tibetensis]ALJ00712.1 hypothetical protein DC20_19175 [Rufibacter tibetensis]